MAVEKAIPIWKISCKHLESKTKKQLRRIYRVIFGKPAPVEYSRTMLIDEISKVLPECKKIKPRP